jgi:hypothetical protein
VEERWKKKYPKKGEKITTKKRPILKIEFFGLFECL